MFLSAATSGNSNLAPNILSIFFCSKYRLSRCEVSSPGFYPVGGTVVGIIRWRQCSWSRDCSRSSVCSSNGSTLRRDVKVALVAGICVVPCVHIVNVFSVVGENARGGSGWGPGLHLHPGQRAVRQAEGQCSLRRCRSPSPGATVTSARGSVEDQGSGNDHRGISSRTAALRRELRQGWT